MLFGRQRRAVLTAEASPGHLYDMAKRRQKKLPTWAISEAQVSTHLVHKFPPHVRLEDLENWAIRELRKSGYRITEKGCEYLGNNLFVRRWRSFTTTLPLGSLAGGGVNLIALSSGWERKDIRFRIATYLHELVHVRQIEAVGAWRFVARYMFNPMWRWVYEMQGYRQTLVALRTLGMGNVGGMAVGISKSMYAAYRMQRIDEPNFHVRTVAALRSDT